MLCGGRGQQYLVLIFFVSLQFLSELNNIFHVKDSTFEVKSIDDWRKI